MRNVTDTSLSLAHAYSKGPDDRSLQPWAGPQVVDSPGNKHLPERHCPPRAPAILRQGSTLLEGSSLLESAGVELVSAGQRAVWSPQETVRGRPADECSFREHVQDISRNVGLKSIKCSMEGQRDPFAVPLAEFQSTTELKSRLLELTKGRDIVYKDKEGDMVLLDNQNWDFFSNSVQEMLIRRHSTKSTSALCDTVLVCIPIYIIMHTAISLLCQIFFRKWGDKYRSSIHR